MKNKFRSDIHPGAMARDLAGNICRVVGGGDETGRVKVVYAENTPYELFANKNASDLKAIPFSAREIAMMSLLAVDSFEVMKKISLMFEGDFDIFAIQRECNEVLKKLGKVHETVKYGSDN